MYRIVERGKISIHSQSDITYQHVPKDFRLITLERLVDAHIKEERKGQHAYLRDKFVESVLHEVVRTIEKSLRDKETLGAFLDYDKNWKNLVLRMLESKSFSLRDGGCHDQEENNQMNATRVSFISTIVAYRD